MVVLVDSVVGAAALPGAPPPVVAKTPPEWAGEAVALAFALAAGVFPGAAPPVSPAVAVGRGPRP